MPLTDTTIRNAKPGPKPRRLADGGGLTLSIRPNGTKAWRLRYRFRGKEQQLSLGIYPDVTLLLARQLRDEYRQLLAHGVNPSDQRKATLAGTVDDTSASFESLAREWYESKVPNWVPGHASMVLMRLEKYVFPTLGARPIADISAQDIHAMLKPIQDQKKYETASRVLMVVRQVCDYALFSERITRNPAAPVKQLLTKHTPKHFAAVTDPKAVAKLLRMLHAYEGSPAVMAAMNLAPLWFVRPGELRRARWDDIDLDGPEPQWKYFVTKTHTPHIVPLATQAVAILRALHPHTRHQEYIFPGERSNQRPMSENTLAVAMRTGGVAQGTHTIHGWRATARTLLDEELHFPPHLIEYQLAHAMKDPLGRSYNRTTHIAERKKLMQVWADLLRGAPGTCRWRGPQDSRLTMTTAFSPGFPQSISMASKGRGWSETAMAMAQCVRSAAKMEARQGTQTRQAPRSGSSTALQQYNDNGNDRITCAEARRHGIAPVRRSHPAYRYINDRDNDGTVCEHVFS
jgi:integrase